MRHRNKQIHPINFSRAGKMSKKELFPLFNSKNPGVVEHLSLKTCRKLFVTERMYTENPFMTYCSISSYAELFEVDNTDKVKDTRSN